MRSSDMGAIQYRRLLMAFLGLCGACCGGVTVDLICIFNIGYH